MDEKYNMVKVGTDPFKIFSECIQSYLNCLGEKFNRLEMFLSKLIMPVTW